MNNYFFGLYEKLSKMGMDCRDLDSMLNALPWKEERKEDGTIIYTCEVKNE